MDTYILAMSTVPDKKTGQTIASSCVKKKLAACVTISGASTSHYRWKRRLVQDREYILFIKTKASLFPALKENLLKQHPYQVPEIIALPLVDGHQEYLEWLDKETKALDEE